MNNKKDQISIELEQISPALTTISRNNVYSVPLNYFDGLAGNIMRFIKGNIAGSILPLSSPAPFTLPPNYFNTLSGDVLNKIRQQNEGINEVYRELAEVAPLLNTISKKMIYQVPEHYFETVIKIPVNQTVPAKIRSISSFNRVFKYSVAAAVTGILAVGTYFYTEQNNGQADTAKTTSINIPAAVDKLSDAEIVDYLNNNTFVSDVSPASYNMGEVININDDIRNLSDEEIRIYLKENEEPKKVKVKDS